MATSHKDWKSLFYDFADSFYTSKKDTVSPAKPDNTMSNKMIILIVLVSVFAVVILSVFLLVLFNWICKKKNKNKQLKPFYDKIGNGTSYDVPPKHLNLMRTDSSLSEVSRDSSFPPTPLSPLSEEGLPSDAFGRGRLEFTLQYETDNERLKATVVQAHGLPQRHCIFYVEGYLLPDQNSTQKTSIRYHNPSPIFEEAFKFDLPFAELPERTLYFRLFELDSFSQETMIGKVLYSFDVDAVSYKTPLKLDMELSPNMPHDNNEQVSIGEVLVSLCYLPTSGRLTLVVLKCCLLQASDGLPDPFLKVSLVLNRKHVKKIKTSIKKKTLNAVYNEAFIFDVPTEHISSVGLYARILNDREDQKVLGKVVIGPQAKTSMGVHHWERMLLSPRKPIAQWHSIR